MARRQVPLNASAQVVLSASGGGQCSVGPSLPRVTWQLASAAVGATGGASSVTNDAQCQIYFGGVAASGQLLDTTLTGSSGDSSSRVASVGDIHSGQKITAVWTGGDPGATVALTVFGTQEIPG